jgi:hypothetical protein
LIFFSTLITVGIFLTIEPFLFFVASDTSDKGIGKAFLRLFKAGVVDGEKLPCNGLILLSD